MTRFPRLGDNFTTCDLPDHLRGASPSKIAEYLAKRRRKPTPDAPARPAQDVVIHFRPRAPITRGFE